MDNRKQQAINMIGKQTNNEGFYAVPAPKGVVIDGCLDDWDLSGQIQSYADSAVKDIFSVKTAAMWDEDYLYLAFDWRDPYPLESQYNPTQDPARGWMSDSAQLRFFCGGQPSWYTTWCFEGDKPALRIDYLDPGKLIGLKAREKDPTRVYYNGTPGENDLGDGILMAYRLADDGKGFTQECRFPWKVLYDTEHKAVVGDIIRLGLDFHWGEAGGNNRPIHTYCDNVRPGDGMRVFFWTKVDNWGDLKLMDGPVEKRIYREEAEAPAGTIPLRVKVPADATTFTVTINTPDGKRVRNVAGGMNIEDYKVAEADGMAEVEILWDGLDESGKLMQEGEYVLKGITANGLDGYFESSFYNPGTPAWKTPDTKGGWGADHTIIKLLARAGEAMVMCSTFAEGGYATFALNTTGEFKDKKRWSDLRGTDSLAANDKYIFIIPNDWAASGVELLRINPHTGKFLPFQKDGKDTPMPYRLTELFGVEEAPVVTALALAGDTLLMRCDDHTVKAIHADTGAVERIYPLTLDNEGKGTRFGLHDVGKADKMRYYHMTTDGKGLYYIVEDRICRMDLATGECTETNLNVAETPISITIDEEGCFYIADFGKANQVIKVREDGTEVMRYGIPSGRPRVGKYNPNGFIKPCSVALDSEGNLWVVEDTRCPRRVSVWAKDGSFIKEFVGNCGYAGQATLIHNNDPKKAFAEFNEMVQDEDGTWRVENVMYNPDPDDGGLHFTPECTPFDSGSLFYSEASGEKREYFVMQGWHFRSSFFMMMKDGNLWKPVAGIASLANLLHGFARACDAPTGEWADCDINDLVFWNDYNGDGLVTRDECVVLPAVYPAKKNEEGKFVFQWHHAPYYICTSGAPASDDLSLYFTKVVPGGKNVVCVLKPTGFRDGGMPIYGPEGFIEQTDAYKLVDCSYPIPGKDLTVVFIEQEKKTYVAGIKRSTGELLWKYISPYHEVHGSHHAPMCKPGLLIGCLTVKGYAPNCGDSDVIMIRGNLGEDYYLTTDGEYIDTLTRDERLPGLAVPNTLEEVKKISFRQFSGRGEHFSGRFTKHDDGVARCHGGMPACEAGNIIRIEGLDNVKHYAPVTVTVTNKQLVEANAANQERELAKLQPKDAIEVAANLADAKQFAIEKEGQGVKGSVQVASADGLLKLRYEVNGIQWVNGGNNWRILFKTGDCVDFQLSPSANKESNPVAGDFRLLVAPFEGKNVAVLMRQVDPEGVPAGSDYRFTSPVQTLAFGTVRMVEEAKISVNKADNKVIVEAVLPWAAIDMAAPAAGTKLTGDAGIIVGDADNKINIARIYRNNGSTNLVNDQPGEARIAPNGFGDVQF